MAGVEVETMPDQRPVSTATTKVDEMMGNESRISHFSKPEQDEDESKAQYAWRLIRHCVKNAIDNVKKADIKDMVISHGVHQNRRLNHVEPVKQILYNKITKEYLTIDSKVIRVFMADGRKKELVTPAEHVDRLIFASQMNLYVGWTPGTSKLVVFVRSKAKLMTHEFEVSSISEAPRPIESALYNESVGEIVTIGPGHLTSWVFRYGGRHLLPRKTMTEILKDDTSYSHLVLEETASRSQRAFAASETNVAVFNLFDGRLIEVKKELHVRMITALLFFNPLKYLVTASKDGSIKVWDDQWHLQLVFVGHGDVVTSLALFPYGPLIMSASLDCTIRVWSLETCDEVDIVATTEPALSLVTAINQEEFASVSTHHADLWKIHHVHTLHTRIGYKVTNIQATDHPGFPTRCVLLCKDSSVRILCPINGDVLTTLLVDPKRGLVDAAYTIENDLMFAVYQNGDIIKCNTASNPCKILGEWKCEDAQRACNYLLVYEYVVSTGESDSWGAMKRAINAKGLTGNRTLLLGGRRDGYICVFDMETGNVDFEIEAHGMKGVLTMIANSKSDQLISAGRDNIIKIWRLYPYAQESLAPLMSFYCAHTPINMTVMKGKLSVAFQEHTTATYSVVMYNLDKKNRNDHGPEEDHMDTITGLTSCPKIKIVASSSIDNTVRIWNENNTLIRIIKLNARPHSITFCSSKGDLLVGIGDHVHIIDYKKYLPKIYRFKMVSMQFPQPVIEKSIPFCNDLLNELSRDDVKRLKGAKSSFNEPVHGWCQQSVIPSRFTHFMDLLTDDETDEVMREKKDRQKAFNKIGERDKELQQLKDGLLTAKRKPKSTPETKNEAFNKYLKFFYDRPRIKLPPEDLYAEDTIDQLVKGPTPPKDVYKPEKEPTGFFPPAHTAHQPTDSDEEKPPIKPDCYVPNSVLLRLLWPTDELEDTRKQDETYRPPGMTEEQMRQIASLNEKADLGFRDSTILLDYGSDSEKQEKESKPETPLSVVNKVQEMLAKVPTPPPVSPPSPDPVDRLPTPPPAPKPKLKEKTTQPFVRLPPKAPPKEPPKEVNIPTPPPPTPPAPDTPLPDFISQFTGLEWFEKYFPDAGPETFPKPWNISAFVNMLLRTMKVAEYRYKVDIANALISLNQEEGLPHPENIQKTLLALLGPKRNAPSSVMQDQKDFIIIALELMQILGLQNRDFYVELMVQFMENDMEVRRKVLQILKVCGLKDETDYLVRELDSWDVWDMDEDERPHELRQMCREWLDKWLASFKIHLVDTIDRLKKGQNVHGRVSKSRSNATQSKSILRKDTDVASEVGEEDPTKSEGVQFISKPPSAASHNKMLTVTFDRAPDASAVDNATYIEAMNYFCEMQLEKELEKMRSGVPPREGAKNTVLVLPKLTGKSALVRLGETHTSKCRPHRETVRAADLRLPPITARGHQPRPGELFAFPTCVNLPMKPVYMNPFPNPGDALELLAQQPVLLTLKSAQKYFVPSRSLVPTEYY